ncbi:Hint domain-containing protein [Paracoccus luteus]|uniref:Hint domain-containing protein n=1 Tax=Paracoccus luteus TaxID=2508543 RepID=UPI001FEC857F|nr:Hint domain-containing protein [Paracoccus luteus]
MPISTVNWLWIGNRPMLDPSPLTSINVAQRNAILGHRVEGRDQIEAVSLDGNYATLTPASPNSFVTVWDGTARGIRPTTFSYDADDRQVTGVNAISAFRVTMRIQTGSQPDVFQDQQATLVQMSNGDLFFRPFSATVGDWATIDRVHSIEVIAVDQRVSESFGAINHTTSFRPEIFDVAFPCFAAGTLIDTVRGPVAVERLRAGDLVRTAAHGFQPIRWIGSRTLDRADLARRPGLRPIRIAVGALGEGRPGRDLLVSPQHRMLVRSAIAQRMFGAPEVLVAAKHLIGLPGIAVATCERVDYVHFMCDRHQVVFAEGAATESLYAGAEAIRTLPGAARDEILALFPELANAPAPRPARPLVPGRQGRQLARRHIANERPLIHG